MKTVKQLLRQPMKTLFGVILIAIAVAALCVCLGQSIAAAQTQAQLNELFMSLSLPALNYSKEADEWALSFAEEYPEIVKDVGTPGLVAAYIPEMIPDNYTSYLYQTQSMNMNFTLAPNIRESEYTSAMLEILLTELDAPEGPQQTNVNIDGRKFSYTSENVAVTLKGIIQNVVGLAEGYQNPTDFTAIIYLRTTQEQLQKMDLRVGERYLVYTTNYWDSDWWLRSYFAQNISGLDGELLEPFAPENMTLFSHDEIVEFNGSDELNNLLQIVGKYNFTEKNLLHGMERWTMGYYRTVLLEIEDETSVFHYNVELEPNGTVSATPIDTFGFTESDGTVITISAEEYHARYNEPTIVHLSGSAEEFLASSEGELWQEALRNIEINANAFPVIGVDNLNYIAEFARDWTNVSQGRDFTEKELKNGSKVCIISDTLAQLNGLSVGDTISARFYTNDEKIPYQVNIREGNGSVNPAAYFYFERTTDFSESTEEYEIVGIYHQNIQRGNLDNNLYAFTPNTIFVPQKSVAVEMDYGYAAFFRTFILENGKMGEFSAAAAEAGFADQFFYDDNGYSAVGGGIENYRESVRHALLIAVATYGIILLLFLVLYPAQQRKNLVTMESLGATRGARFFHVLFNSLGIFVPGTVVGVTGGILLWQRVTDLLVKESGASINIAMEPEVVVGIGVAQLGAALLLTGVVARLLVGRKSLMRQK